jgi:hypothetical protein
MTDDNAETWNGRLGAFALVERSLTDAEVEQLGVAKRGGIFAAEETGVLEFDFVRENSFINGRIRAVIGDALLVDRVFKSEYGPDDGASFSPLGPGGGLRLSTDYGMGVPSYTLVFDLWLDAVQPGSFGSLIQTDGENSGDGDLFLRDNGDGTFGIGISGGECVCAVLILMSTNITHKNMANQTMTVLFHQKHGRALHLRLIRLMIRCRDWPSSSMESW